jgi:solute:Na+ symporter, SSS family
VIPTIIMLVYLALIAGVGAIAFRKSKASGEDYFLASRSLGSAVFLLSLFGTNMTAFAILGSSGMAYQRGIGVYGLMASSSALIIPLCLFFIGTRLWWLGKKFGHMTQVDYFRDRWECSHIGTVIFVLTAAMLVPYILIALIGGGKVLETLSMHAVYLADGTVAKAADGITPVQAPYVPYSLGAAAVVFAVSIHVFLGGMRGAAWVNTFQTILFLVFGAIAFVLIGNSLGGYDQVMAKLHDSKTQAALLSRERIPQAEFFSYLFIPLSSIMFPHMAIMCLSARKVSSFKTTVSVYPICIMLIWLPAVFLGVVAASQFIGLKPGETDSVILRLINLHTGPFIAAFLGAGIMSCVMSSDSHQILGLVTMFTRDIFAHYGGKERFGERAQLWTGRIFVLIISLIAYVLAVQLKDKESIFALAIRFAFSGFAALAPVMVAALFWKRSTKWGALAAALWVGATVIITWYLQDSSVALLKDLKPGTAAQIYPALGDLLLRSAGGVTVYGYLPVVPMVLGSAALMWVVSLLTAPPSAATVEKYFPAATTQTATSQPAGAPS